MSKITAKAIVTNRTPHGEPGNTGMTITLGADYNDERNKEWAYYTPGLSIQMTVRESVADAFPLGAKFTLTFDSNDLP